MRAPATVRSATSRAASAPAARRTGAEFSPRSAVSGGSHSAKVRLPRGLRSSATTSHGSPVNRSAAAPGSAEVAEASTNTGEAPYFAQIRRSRRSTSATFEPNTPR